jgi:aminopeptidase YwaD
VVVLLALGASCQRDRPVSTSPDAVSPTAPVDEAAPPAEVDIEALRAHVSFLAADEQGGRAPGTPEDRRVQAYIVQQMKSGGLQPAFGDSHHQSVRVTDGVELAAGGTILDVSGIPIAHSPLPFSLDTSTRGPSVTKFVFVGHGVAPQGQGTGDYKGLARVVDGKVVVALHGGGPHAQDGAQARAQSKAITAREHGAVGFVLWDPAAAVPYANHGDANNLGVPALFVGSDGNAAMVEAFTGKKDAAVDSTKLPIRRGAVTRRPGTIQTHVKPRAVETANIAGIVRGDGSDDAVVVIGAHMDHLGMGTHTSLAPDERAVHNGADDNASGVAVMLEICGTLARSAPASRPYDVLCIAFGAEEMGLLGSKHFVKTLEPDLKSRIKAMLNFDMVGRLRDDTIMVAGVGTSSVWSDLVEAHRGGLTVTPTEDGYGPSDHGSFYEAGIPVLHFFTGPHEDYHRPSDDIEKIDFAGAKRIADMALGIVGALLEGRVRPDYKETERTTPGGQRQSFRVSLGTIPDYAAKVDGVALSGVRKGGAADQAGLQKGDVIKKIGDREIHNFDEFMAMFGVLTPGEPVPVVLERGGQTVVVTLTPSAPTER